MTGAGYFTRTYEHWRFVETQDELGQPIETWEKQSDVKGRAWPISADFQRTSEYSFGEIQWRFAADPSLDLKIADEIRFDGRRLTVDVVPVTSTGRRLEAECREVPSA